jgi:shikimate kinase
MRVYLTGFMGAGKTTIGRKLAKLLNMPFLDTDAIIEKEQKQKINDIFNIHGENYFREKERDALQETLKLNDAIIATGGGTVCSDENADFILANGLVVFIEIPVEEITLRLLKDKKNRPLLNQLESDKALMEFVVETYALRFPYYEKAHLKFDGLQNKTNKIRKLAEIIDSYEMSYSR